MKAPLVYAIVHIREPADARRPAGDENRHLLPRSGSASPPASPSAAAGSVGTMLCNLAKRLKSRGFLNARRRLRQRALKLARPLHVNGPDTPQACSVFQPNTFQEIDHA
jgi:hypothetical protein